METTPPLHLPAIDASGNVPADDEASTLAYVNNIDQECYESLNGMPADAAGSVNSWLQLADDNLRVYEIGDIDGVTPVYANDIQNAIIAITDRQTRDPVMTMIEPVTVDDKPVFFWVGSPSAAMQFNIDPVFVSGAVDPMTGRQHEPPPLPDQITEMLPPEVLENESLFAKVNGESIADFYQSLHDQTWERSRLDQWFRSNTLQNNIVGWQFALYEFDHPTKTVMMTELSVHQVRIDPTVSTIDKAAYAGVWLLVDQTWATRRYPKLATMVDPNTGENIIEQESKLGNPLPGSSTTNPLAELMSVNFRRKMLVMQIWWFRNQYIKLTPEEAVAQGHVTQTQIPIEQESSNAITSGQQSVGDIAEYPGVPSGQNLPQDGQEEGQGQGQQTGGGGGDADGGQVGPTPDVGAGDDVIPAPIPARQAFIHAQTGEEVDPSHKDWPTRLGLGRMVVINDRIAEWVEEDSWDMQLVHNVCIPIPRKPWGIGEPYRLLNMQRAYNRVWGSVVDHCDWNAHPPALMSKTMHDMTLEHYKDARVKPGTTLVIDDQTFRDSGGKLDVIQPLPVMGAHLPMVEQRMSQKLSESSGNTDVLQGRDETQARSGKAIELLQSAGESTISLKAQSSGDMIYRLDRHILHDIARSFTVEDAMKIVKKYPPQVVRYMLAVGPEIEMRLSVSIGGGGTVGQQKRQRDQQDLAIGAISMETYRDRNNIDHKQESARIAEQMAQQAQQAQQAGQGQKGPAESISYQNLPPSGQIQMAQQAGITLTHADIQQQQQAQQMQKQQETAQRANQAGANGRGFARSNGNPVQRG